MSIKDIINNDLVQEESSVWLLEQHSKFDYSDGLESERYLESVFREARDLSSSSSELENYIKDWPSEYHLSAKRAQLFAGFDFDSSQKILEVGCGCGAITRYLGETFNDVISIEGSIKRARLAKLRTKELESVSIICAPFQEIGFTRKFDIIFCIGVYEYSASFVLGEDPYDSVLSYFSDMLTPNGIVIMAIENQFGLKYFNSSREDHTGTMFEGLEGYHAHGNKVKTFGKNELEAKLRKHFTHINFYYPYPDYKLPTCIITDDFLSSGRAGELVSQISSQDYGGERQSLWNESLVTLELSRNGMLPFFSNSFLVLAGKSEIAGASFNQLAVIVSSQRNGVFRTQTQIHNNENGEITVLKNALSGDSVTTVGKLNLVESCSVWKDTYSLHTMLYRNCMSKNMGLEDIFMPCRAWINDLKSMSEYIDEIEYLPGEYIDCIWSNIYLDSTGIAIIDKEWIWKEKIKFNVVIIRSIFTFLHIVKEARHLSKTLHVRNLKRLITLIAKSMDIKLNNKDFTDFIELESEFQSLIHKPEKTHTVIMLQWLLIDSPSFYFFRKLRRLIGRINLRIKTFTAHFYKNTGYS